MALLKIKQIEGLQNALNGKSASSHTHAASNITSGVFSSARIPSLPTSRITSGTFVDARIPTLQQSKISGLVNQSTNFETRIKFLESNFSAPANLSVDGSEPTAVTNISFDTKAGNLTIQGNGGALTLNAKFVSFNQSK